MKTLLKLGFVVIVVLFALSACNLIKDISVGWNITSVTEGTPPSAPAGDSYVTIVYDISNVGKYDLSGVKLRFRLWVADVGYFLYFTTSEFSLSEGQTIYSNTIVIDIVPFHHLVFGDYAEVVGVDMDKPSDS